MTLKQIFHSASHAGSGSTLDIVHNDENGLFGVIVFDGEYKDLIVINRETVRDMMAALQKVVG